MPETSRLDTARSNYAPGIKSFAANATWPGAAQWSYPANISTGYNVNVAWQDTSSSASYCSAASVLGGGQ